MNIDLIFGVISFSGIVLILVMIIMAARSKLVSTGDVTIEINGDASNPLVVPAGSKLLQTLAENKIFLSSACGGGGTCSQCKCVVLDGGGSILPTEESHFNSREKNEGWRLSCQVPVKSDMKIEVPEEIFGVKEWECEVLSNDNVFVEGIRQKPLTAKKKTELLSLDFNDPNIECNKKRTNPNR